MKIGPQQIKAAIELWKRAVPKSKQKKLAARAKLRKKKRKAYFDLVEAGADRQFAAIFAGTSEGAIRGWETRRAGATDKGDDKEKSKQEIKDKVNEGTASKDELKKLTMKDLIGVSKSLGIKYSGTKAALIERVHEKVKGNDVHLRAQKGDKKAAGEVVEKYQGLVHSIVNGYAKGGGVDREELVQEVNLGILRALKDFDPAKGSFSTHASNWIRQKFGRAAKKEYKLNKLESGSEMPDLMDNSTKHPSISITSKEEHQQVGDMLKNLDERSSNILKMRYGIGGGEPKTMEETAKSFGLSKQRVHQIEAAALKKLKGMSAEFSELIDKIIDEAETLMFMALFGSGHAQESPVQEVARASENSSASL